MTTSFLDMMRKGGVRIPKIQRDYAMGRLDKGTTEVRERFVRDLMESVWTGKTLSLDFVYGFSKTGVALIPLDGQQRLTTLFLLAWFCGQPMNGWTFDYESRRAAQCFMRGLVAHPRRSQNTPSVEIRATVWFLPAWAKDSSVAGMLVMLDAFQAWMEKHPGEVSGRQPDFSRIVYETLDCGEASEDEYGQAFLRMNARGLPLTDWEKLKAVLARHAPAGWMERLDGKYTEQLWIRATGDMTRGCRRSTVQWNGWFVFRSSAQAWHTMPRCWRLKANWMKLRTWMTTIWRSKAGWM